VRTTTEAIFPHEGLVGSFGISIQHTKTGSLLTSSGDVAVLINDPFFAAKTGDHQICNRKEQQKQSTEPENPHPPHRPNHSDLWQYSIALQQILARCNGSNWSYLSVARRKRAAVLHDQFDGNRSSGPHPSRPGAHKSSSTAGLLLAS